MNTAFQKWVKKLSSSAESQSDTDLDNFKYKALLIFRLRRGSVWPHSS